MSRLLTPRNLAIAGAGAAALYLIPRSSIGKANPLKTPGVQNIEDRYNSGGATPTHAPGVASRTGTTESVQPPQEKTKGQGSKHYEDNILSQRPANDEKSNKASEKWLSANTGSEKGR